MQSLTRAVLTVIAVSLLSAGVAQKPAVADDVTFKKFRICGGAIAPPTPQSNPFPGAIGGFIGCVGEELTYVETLTSIVENGMPVGSLGEATFVFPDGTVSTENLSLIVGASDDGTVLFVKSVGVITGGTGAYAGANGGFFSKSEVNALTFEFQTKVKMLIVTD